MANELAGGVFVVAAIKGGQTEYWAAATRREEALEAVQQQLPPEWKASRITDKRLSVDQVAALKLRPGGVRKLKQAP